MGTKDRQADQQAGRPTGRQTNRQAGSPVDTAILRPAEQISLRTTIFTIAAATSQQLSYDAATVCVHMECCIVQHAANTHVWASLKHQQALPI